MDRIQSLIADLAADTGEDYCLVATCSMGLWSARIIARLEPRAPLFDRRGDRQLLAHSATSMPAAIEALDALCA